MILVQILVIRPKKYGNKHLKTKLSIFSKITILGKQVKVQAGHTIQQHGCVSPLFSKKLPNEISLFLTTHLPQPFKIYSSLLWEMNVFLTVVSKSYFKTKSFQNFSLY